jgi:hypothetical protein
MASTESLKSCQESQELPAKTAGTAAQALTAALDLPAKTEETERTALQGVAGLSATLATWVLPVKTARTAPADRWAFQARTVSTARMAATAATDVMAPEVLLVPRGARVTLVARALPVFPAPVAPKESKAQQACQAAEGPQVAMAVTATPAVTVCSVSEAPSALPAATAGLVIAVHQVFRARGVREDRLACQASLEREDLVVPPALQAPTAATAPPAQSALPAATAGLVIAVHQVFRARGVREERLAHLAVLEREDLKVPPALPASMAGTACPALQGPSAAKAHQG